MIVRRITINLLADDPDSTKIIEWLDRQQQKTNMSQTIRQVLVSGIETHSALQKILEYLVKQSNDVDNVHMCTSEPHKVDSNILAALTDFNIFAARD